MPTTRQTALPEGDIQKLSILIIEDDPLIRKVIALYLQEQQYTVIQAGDGHAGLNAFRTRRPDVVLTDLCLPGLGGLDILAHIRREAPDTPVIIVSGMGTLTDAIKAIRIGAWDYITKPIDDMEVIKQAISQAMERASLIRENRRYQHHLEKEIKKRTAQLHQAQKLEAIGTLAGALPMISITFSGLSSVLPNWPS
ncbi:hypothetical protein GF1_01530 [Desulfolithobacter dissulfuricans]|uniref:Response regulatory domain-containing protein n=1 Tax=Desulfolithobacter dissulfuricans TaxID=2795293 RepID=A0A915U4J8_9BACT|nr:response regulator [Desulfolithobacter dissulfuricans]BCO07777.1 hypothetical protein GF1_01530 [Desulfolithobacter dissulfuricans]